MNDEVKQVEELVALGGKFYTMGGESWCDLPTESWKFVIEKGGYVRMD